MMLCSHIMPHITSIFKGKLSTPMICTKGLNLFQLSRVIIIFTLSQLLMRNININKSFQGIYIHFIKYTYTLSVLADTTYSSWLQKFCSHLPSKAEKCFFFFSSSFQLTAVLNGQRTLTGMGESGVWPLEGQPLVKLFQAACQTDLPSCAKEE